jgi:glycosyltransferase involved in cell wall biosynthesis
MPRIGLNAHLLSRQGTYRSAGVSRYIAKLLAHLPDVDAASEYVAFLSDAGLTAPRWHCSVSPWVAASPSARIVWEQVCQPLAARRQRLDLLHAPVNVGPMVTACPLVVTVHDLSFVRYPQMFTRARQTYLQRFTRWTLARAQAVIADSASTRRDLIALLGAPEERVVVVHAGIDEELAPVTDEDALESFRRRHDLPREMILFLGTLEPRKNIPTLIEAYGQLYRAGRVAHTLVIAGGKGWLYDEVYATVERLGLQDAVRFAGYVAAEELPLWYSAADLFCYPSFYEGFGLPPLEAMACGIPVVCSNASSLPEVVGDAGILLPPQEPGAWAGMLAHVLDNPPLQADLRERGLRRAHQLTWETAARRTLDVYHSVLTAPAGRADR